VMGADFDYAEYTVPSIYATGGGCFVNCTSNAAVGNPSGTQGSSTSGGVGPTGTGASTVPSGNSTGSTSGAVRAVPGIIVGLAELFGLRDSLNR
jgi:hypothetical protein